MKNFKILKIKKKIKLKQVKVRKWYGKREKVSLLI